MIILFVNKYLMSFDSHDLFQFTINDLEFTGDHTTLPKINDL